MRVTLHSLQLWYLIFKPPVDWYLVLDPQRAKLAVSQMLLDTDRRIEIATLTGLPTGIMNYTRRRRFIQIPQRNECAQPDWLISVLNVNFSGLYHDAWRA